MSIPSVLYHYTDEAGYAAILAEKKLRPSLKAHSPKDARYGDGQYLSDIVPGSKRPGQLSYAFLKIPWAGRRFSHYIAINIDGLVVTAGRDGVYVVLNTKPLDISKRIVAHGRVSLPTAP
jgi:hypothetical protein